MNVDIHKLVAKDSIHALVRARNSIVHGQAPIPGAADKLCIDYSHICSGRALGRRVTPSESTVSTPRSASTTPKPRRSVGTKPSDQCAHKPRHFRHGGAFVCKGHAEQARDFQQFRLMNNAQASSHLGPHHGVGAALALMRVPGNGVQSGSAISHAAYTLAADLPQMARLHTPVALAIS